MKHFVFHIEVFDYDGCDETVVVRNVQGKPLFICSVEGLSERLVEELSVHDDDKA